LSFITLCTKDNISMIMGFSRYEGLDGMKKLVIDIDLSIQIIYKNKYNKYNNL